VIQEATHTAGFLSLYGYEQQLAPDVIAVLKPLGRGLVKESI